MRKKTKFGQMKKLTLKRQKMIERQKLPEKQWWKTKMKT
jgi:hypothetical protein